MKSSRLVVTVIALVLTLTALDLSGHTSRKPMDPAMSASAMAWWWLQLRCDRMQRRSTPTAKRWKAGWYVPY